ncbi:hypothetical protein EV360DRAFT_90625 [Lentinula raphanica]|nr:hypothetical protein EV360DRAFT_90625 [Lentinula raphanica]
MPARKMGVLPFPLRPVLLERSFLSGLLTPLTSKPSIASTSIALFVNWGGLPALPTPYFFLALPRSARLPRYTHPEDVDFEELLDQNTEDIRPDTFYPSQLTTFCTTFASGPESAAEGYQLYQALAFLQRGLARIIRGHLARSEIHRRLIAFTNLPSFSYSLQYYQLFWHGRCNCPLVAPLLVILVCEFCEDHLSDKEYASQVYDSQIRDGPGMSTKTRDRLLEDITELFELQDLALPLPFDPSTREGQLIVTVASQGSRVDQILHPVSLKPQLPDPSFLVTHPAPLNPLSSKRRIRPPSPDFGQTQSSTSPRLISTPRKTVHAFPVAPDPIDVDAEDDPAPSKTTTTPDVLIVRQSLARTAKTKPKIPEEFRKGPAPAAKRERSPADLTLEPPIPLPKKRRTQAASGKTRANTPALPVAPRLVTPDVPVRIQEGPPDYFDEDDVRTAGHQGFLTNPDFKVKVPFSQLIKKTIAQNPRAPKLPFLRAPKWQLSEEMKDFGAFINSPDTTFSLQGLSRYNYLASRPLQPTVGTTLPSPEALHSHNNCLTCLSRGVVCEGGGKLGGACSHCDRTHRNCPSCLGLDEHKDRFLAIHNTVQGYPAGYSGSLDRFRSTLDEMTHVATSFETIFDDVRRRLALNLQEVQANGFDFNVVLSKWTEDNPNLPLDYDLLTWLATFFGWDSACNLSAFLVDPADAARLEDFLRNNTSSSTETADSPAPPPAPASTSATSLPITTPASPTTLNSLESPHRPRRRPAAATPSNFFSNDKFHTPPASTTVEEEMEVDEETSRASVAQALVTAHDDIDDEEDAEVEPDDDVPVEIAPPASLNISKSRK